MERHEVQYETVATPDPGSLAVKAVAEDVGVTYGGKVGLHGVSMKVYANQVTALMGPSGCGKSTFLRCLNRTNELIADCRQTGFITLDGMDIHHHDLSVEHLRRRVTMVAQKPDPFPDSVYENIAYGPKLHGQVYHRADIDERVERCLRRAALWDEVKDRLHQPGTDLSGGQQQRLCIARALSVEPEIVLMDEPCSSIDPIATGQIEDLIRELQGEITVLIVTHNLQQAARLAHWTAYFHLGELVEYGPSDALFHAPKDRRVQDFVTGKFG